MEYLGLISAIFIGISLGLIGSGGSILTVPVLVYLLAIDPVNATAYSLFIVGITSLVGAISYYKRGLINFSAATVFAIPAFIAVFATRYYIVPAIPDELFSIQGFVVTKQVFIMILFAVLMFVAAISMIKKNDCDEIEEEVKYNYPQILIEGVIVGIFTGLVGAGGGFLIIPALVIFAKIPMKIAVGTSLIIIAVKSLIGFLGDLGANTVIDWSLLFGFSLIAIIGIFVGMFISKFIEGKKLKPIFGWFVLSMSVYIVIKEVVLFN